MKKNPKIFLLHILQSIDLIEEYTKDFSKDNFMKSIQVQDSVTRRLEIIGEAIKNLPEDFKNLHPQIEWHKAISMRNILIHEYFGVDLELLWVTIATTLPRFKSQIKPLILSNDS